MTSRVSLTHDYSTAQPLTSLWALNKQSLHAHIPWKPLPTSGLINLNYSINTSLNQRNEKPVVATWLLSVSLN